MRYELYRSILFLATFFLASFTIFLISAILYASILLMYGIPDTLVTFLLGVSAGGSMFVMIISLWKISGMAREELSTGRGEMPALTQSEQRIVDTIMENGGRILQNSLVNRENISKATVSRTVESLVAKGVITRTRKGVTNELVLEKWK